MPPLLPRVDVPRVDLARVDLARPLVPLPLLVPADLAADFDAVARPPVDPVFAARDFVADALADRVPVEPDLVEREPLPLLPLPEDELLSLSSLDHLPESTRCAASATASAISEPRRVALDIALVAALDAASAASSPASRILRRAAGLALIAAAVAASPAASISRLIATLAILSSVSLSLEPVDPPDELFEDVFFVDFAIFSLPVSYRKDTSERQRFPMRNYRPFARAS